MGGLRALAVMLALIMGGATAATGQRLKSGNGEVVLAIDSSRVEVKFSASLEPAAISDIVHSLPGSWELDLAPWTITAYVSIIIPDLLDYDEAWAILEAIPGADYLEPRYRAPDGSLVLTSEHLAIGLTSQLSVEQAVNIITTAGLENPRSMWAGTNTFVATRREGGDETSFGVAARLVDRGDVLYVYPEIYAPLGLEAYTLWDHYHLEQFHLKNLVGQFNMASVWDMLSLNDTAVIGDTVVVAVLDDGVVAHEDLPASRILPGYDFYYDDSDPSPGEHRGHGLMCAGIIGAGHTLDAEDTLVHAGGVVGMAPATKFIPIKICSDSDSSYTNLVSGFDLRRAIDSAWIMGADILNCSFAYPFNFTFLEEAVARAATNGRAGKGCLIIASSGNIDPYWPSGTLRVPALYDETYVVGACDLDDSVLHYSQYDAWEPNVDVLAPSGERGSTGASEGVWTLDQMGNLGVNRDDARKDDFDTLHCDYGGGNNRDYFCEFDGTSASAPFVSGIAALLLAYDPALTREEVYSILDSSAVPLSATVPDFRRGYGRADAFRAVLSIARGDCNADGQLSLSDVTRLVNYLFVTGDPLVPSNLLGDVDCNGDVNLTDVTLLYNHIFVTFEDLHIPCFAY